MIIAASDVVIPTLAFANVFWSLAFIALRCRSTGEVVIAKRLLLKAALLDHGADMKPCHIGMAVVI